ncbi:MAG TPA: nucleoside triphosphate pyrophosphatase [Pirellulaceae bacterium]|nr:nucleoside triphosphate pyrophosphatase [Pirellulaceae bacterium]
MPRLPLILASSSPRRRQLLQQAGYTFTVAPPHESAEDEPRPGETPRELVARLARQKASDVARGIERGLVIGCDTVAESGGQILGKPADRGDARRMLAALRGQEHRVYSGLCLWRRPDDRMWQEVEITTLVMERLTDAELENYLATGDWQGKAGAFGYQDGLDWVRVVSGSESNVVGLPLELLERMIANVDREQVS